jgi:2-oxoglutarate dehydrogenase E2 component (dihydrolipoamide succinyltransferase)
MIEIKTPVFPESVADGEIAAWHVQVGEGVNRDQILVDIETDKVVLEVVAPSDGKVTEILKAEGETVLAEEVLAMFEAGEVAEKATKADLETSPDTPAVDSLDEATAAASPAARKIAEEQKLDVTSIAGTGKSGRVTKEDVLKAVASAEGQ